MGGLTKASIKKKLDRFWQKPTKKQIISQNRPRRLPGPKPEKSGTTSTAITSRREEVQRKSGETPVAKKSSEPKERPKPNKPRKLTREEFDQLRKERLEKEAAKKKEEREKRKKPKKPVPKRLP